MQAFRELFRENFSIFCSKITMVNGEGTVTGVMGCQHRDKKSRPTFVERPEPLCKNAMFIIP